MVAAISSGSDRHLPRQTRLPPWRTEMKVSFKDTSRPIYCSMVVLRSMHGPGDNREPAFASYRGQPTFQHSQHRATDHGPAITLCFVPVTYQIGRPSCRERVCKYVYISGSAFLLK